MNDAAPSWFASAKKTIKPLLIIVLIMCAVQLINTLTAGILLKFGILPRTFSGLFGIFFAPFLHAGWGHLFNNLLVFIPLSVLLLMRSPRDYWVGSIIIILGCGISTWLFARYSYHVGASGWVFGLWGMILANAWFQRSFASIVCAVLVLIYFGSMWFNLLPSRGVSFEGHIFGVVWGVAFAWLNARHRKKSIAVS